MKVFALTDTHFGHKNIIKYTGRPVDFENIILESVASNFGDLLIHCGDFCFGQDVEWHRRFMLAANGFTKKILVKGNHDNKSYDWYYSHGWDVVCEAYMIRHNGKSLLFTHMPVLDNKTYWSPTFPPDYNIHGHLHGAGVKRIKHMIETGHRKADAEAVGYSLEFHKDVAPELYDCNIVDIDTLYSV